MLQEKKPYWTLLLGLVLLVGLWVTSLYSYLLFHSLAELFSIVVAYSIFALAWNSRHFAKNAYLLFLGIAYLFVGTLDLIHTLGYKGMGVFPGHATNLSTQLWIAARYVESVSLLIAPLLSRRKLKTSFIFAGYTAATAVVLASVFYWHIFPACFIEGEGLTIFKKVSEYVISLLLIGSIIALLKTRHAFERSVLRLLVASIVVTIASELAFTLYADAYGLANLVGHYLKIVSFYLIYVAIVATGLTRPFALLFRDLKHSEDTLKAAKENLEVQIDARTAELTRANVALRDEISAHKQAEEALQEYQRRLKALAAQLTIAEERERRRIAGDLHDRVSQSLALARMQLAAARKATSGAKRTAILDDVSESLREAVQETRQLVSDLSSPAMNEIGLAAAIAEWLEEQVERRHGLKMEFTDECGKVPLDDVARAILFRNVRELVINTVKHAEAKSVAVGLKRIGTNLQIVVQDDGIGYETRAGSGAMGSADGFGLFSIRERMGDLGGSLEIVSSPGKGCRATLTAPLDVQP